ncbi:MAG TPA: SDR family oxidoreductase [Bryobacteraceae bacterium]|nr:SDR family oxidoreductase [Bryobacteraceae bacterium]
MTSHAECRSQVADRPFQAAGGVSGSGTTLFIMMAVPSIDRKVIVVTGGARRIGRAIALRLASEGARVAIHYNHSRQEAEETARACGPDAAVFEAELESVPQIRTLFSAVEAHFGRIDGLVNNAARFTGIDPLDITEEDWDFIHDINLKAVFFCCQEAARRMMREGEGRIVNISSLGAIRPWPQHAHYCASKAGVVHMTRALARAWAPQISVNSVAPGVIPFAEADTPEIQAFVKQTPAARAGTGEEIAEAVLFYLTATRFITGQVTAVDGGLSLR